MENVRANDQIPTEIQFWKSGARSPAFFLLQREFSRESAAYQSTLVSRNPARAASLRFEFSVEHHCSITPPNITATRCPSASASA